MQLARGDFLVLLSRPMVAGVAAFCLLLLIWSVVRFLRRIRTAHLVDPE
jgi:hypothetical protein